MAPKVYVEKNSLNAGEVSQLIEFRDDIEKYKSACRTLENAIPLVEGGAKKIPGSYFAGTSGLGGSMFTGSISGNILTVTAVNYGVLQAGQTIVGAAPGTTITGSGSTTSTGPVTGLGVDFTKAVRATLPPNIVISIAGDGSDASAVVMWNATGYQKSQSYVITWLWTPTIAINGGTGYTYATATVTITNGNPTYPNGTTPYQCVITYGNVGVMGGGGTGVGGTGTYTISPPQTLASCVMQTASNGKSRLVPFQFSTIQGAILEFSAGMVRIWEGASQGTWSLGLATQVPDNIEYKPSIAYVPGNIVSIGPFIQFDKGTLGSLYIAAPYGTTNFNTVPISLSVNTSDVLSVTITGVTPNQGVNIALANTTPANNAASLIQTAIQSLVSLNSPVANFVDLSAWTVTPDPAYYTTPWILDNTTGIESEGNSLAQAILANQNDYFPLTATGTGFNAAYWQPFYGTLPDIEIATPYAEADLFALDCSTQSADVLWIFHPNYPPAVIERRGANLWTYSLILPNQQPGEPAYRGTLDVVKTGYSALGQVISAITTANPARVTVDSTTAAFAPGDRCYINLVAGMVELNQGEFIVQNVVTVAGSSQAFDLHDPDTGLPIDSSGYLAYVSGGFAVKVVPMFAATGDYPAGGTLYQERLCVGGTINNPVQMNGSVQDDYTDFISDPNSDDYAIQFTLVSNKLDQILNMIGTPNALVIGTSGGIWIMSGANGGSLNQTSVVAAKQTTQGVSALQPQLVGDSAIFVSRSFRMVTFLVFDFASNQWNNFDLTRLNRSITLGSSESMSGIAQTGFQLEPYPIFWAVRNDGQLIGLVFNKADQVFAWFRVDMTEQGGIIESVAVVSGQNQEDQVAVVVNRTINGVTQRYVEYFMPQELFGQLSNAFFVNCGQQLQLLPSVPITGITNANPCVVTAPGHGFSNGMQVQIVDVQGMESGTQSINQDKSQAYTISGGTDDTFQLAGMDTSSWSPYVVGGSVMQVTNQVTGLSYLMGQSVVAVGDGAKILEPTVVTNDAMTFPYYCNLITIGIPYKVTVQPTNPVLTSPTGTTRGMKQKLSRVTLSLYQSIGGQFGTDENHMSDIDYGPGSMAEVPQMTTCEVTRDIDADWDDQSTFIVEQDEPFPFTLRGLVMRMSCNQD